MKVFVFDSEKCNGCLDCQLACKDEHVGNDWRPIAAPQPDTGAFWCSIEARERGQVPKVVVSPILHICQHCEDCALIKIAPQAVYRRADGLVIIDPVAAEGRRELVDACPYHAVFWNAEANLAQKCTGCAHLLDDGWSEPRCVDACSHDALLFGDEEELAGFIAAGEPLLPGAPGNPRVYYLNLPKRFIGGIVVDVDADEVVIGATVTLENTQTGEMQTTRTDEFGDFWFKQIPASTYNLYFEREGYLTRKAEASTVEEDRNVGVIELFAQQGA